MLEKVKFQSLTRKEMAGGSVGWLGYEITAVAQHLPKIDWDFLQLPENEDLSKAIFDAGQIIEDALVAASIRNNPETMQSAEQEKQELLALFPSKIFVEEIPNGYSSGGYVKHLPWFVVTTEVGPITIGWRRRVINIDWSKTKGTKNADRLFANEDVTKGEKYIHAWGYDKAREYLKAIINSAN